MNKKSHKSKTKIKKVPTPIISRFRVPRGIKSKSFLKPRKSQNYTKRLFKVQHRG